ncbi:MAG: phosphatase PAP2 family protein [Bacteroidales bacterium]|nr:phosphatase PAP2 family protein [Bacteroidales bacterium]
MIALLAFYVLLQAYRTSSASLSSPVTSRIAAASPLAPNQAPPANSASAAPSPFALSGTFSRVTTIIMTAFFLYYLIYIFLPVSGPQFYFQAVGVDEIMQGHFPALGTYFSSHTDMLPAPGNPDGLFYRLVSSAQATGERPTAAFPSSHIGISTIVLLLARRHAPRLLLILIPLWALLCCATVYIQAHYLIDAIAGLLTAPLILWIADKSMPMLKVQKS